MLLNIYQVFFGGWKMKQLSFVGRSQLSRPFNWLIILSLIIAALAVSPQPVQAAVNCNDPVVECINGTISTNTTWVEGFVYVIQSNVTVAPGVTLTIQGGNHAINRTVVKVEQGRYIDIQGTLIVDSTGGQDHEVIFTSLRDDSKGPVYNTPHDTNGDGNNTTPAKNDWAQIWLYDSTSSINRAIVRYSSQGIGIYNASNVDINPSITYSTFEQNWFGITLFTVGSFTGGVTSNISSNSFSNNKFGIGTEASPNSSGSMRPTLSNNTFQANEILPLYFNGSTYPTYSNNQFIGSPTANQRLAVGLGGYFTSSGALPQLSTNSGTPFDMPYVILNNMAITSGAVVTVPNSGTIFKFEQGAFLEVAGTLDISAATPSDRIIFTSLRDDVGGDSNGDGTDTSPAPGDWNAVILYNDSAPFSNAVVRYATNGLNFYNGQGTLYPIIENNTFEENLTALHFETTSPNITLPKLNYNVFQNNDYFPLVLNGSTYWFEREGNTFAGHIHPAVGLQGVWNPYELGGTVPNEWAAIEGDSGSIFPYVVTGFTTVTSSAHITVPAGLVFKFDRGGAPNYYRYFIDAVGTVDLQSSSSSPIYFTSYKDDSVAGDTNHDGSATTPAPADWEGYFIYGDNNTFHDAEIRYANWGLTVRNMNTTPIAPAITNSKFKSSNNGVSLWASSDGDITSQITDCTFDANGYGLYTLIDSQTIPDLGASRPHLTGNTFKNSTGYPIYLAGTAFPTYDTVSPNTFTNNFYRAIALAGTFNADGTWYRVLGENGKYFPYVIDLTTVVTSNASVTVPASTIFKFQLKQASQEQLRNLDVQGELILESDASQQIVFTSLRDDVYDDTNHDGSATTPAPMDWDSVYLENSVNDFHHAIVKYAYAGVTVFTQNTDLDPQIRSNLLQYNIIGIQMTLLGLGDVTSEISNNQLKQNEYGLYTSVPLCYLNAPYIGYSGTAMPVMNANTFEGYAGVSGHDDFPVYLGGTSEPVWGTGANANTFTNHTHPAIGLGGQWCASFTHSPTVWREVVGEDSAIFPYVVLDLLEQDWNSVIQIPADTIVKVDYDEVLHIYGLLDFESYANHPIVFTAYTDDTYAGDTNADGGATQPYAGYWDAIWFSDTPGKVNNVHHLIVKYATAGVAYYYAGLPNEHINPQITDSTFADNWVGMVLAIGRNGRGNINAGLTNLLFDHNYYDLTTFAVKDSGTPPNRSTTTGVSIPTLTNVTFQDTYYYPIFLGGTAFPQFVGGNLMTNVGSQLSDQNIESLPVPTLDAPDFDLPGVQQAMQQPHPAAVSQAQPVVGNGPDAVRVVNSNSAAIGLGGVFNPDCDLLTPIPCALPTYQNLPFAVAGGYPLVIYINGQPYYVDNNLIVGWTLADPLYPTKTKLVFPSGSIVKFGDGLYLDAFGDLESQGTPSEPVIFTSIHNDSVGGDTNGDGNATLPAPGDWAGLYLKSSATKLENSYMQYSLDGVYIYYSGPVNTSISPEITGSIFINNVTGLSLWADGPGDIESYIHHNLFIDNGTHIYGHPNTSTGILEVQITDNDLLFNTDYGINNASTNWTIFAEYNWWDSIYGPTHSANPDGTGVTVTDRVDYLPYRTSPVFSNLTYEIQGYVKKESGDGLAGVIVSLNTGATVMTDQDGFYAFSGLSYGVYSLSFSLGGYLFEPPSLVANVPPDAFVQDVIGHVTTDPMYSISGQVMDPLSLPVGDVMLTLTASPGGGYVSSATTNAGGGYTFNNLPAGTYIVTPSYQSYTFNPPSRTVTVAPNATGVNFIINAAVGEGFRLTLPLVLR